MIVRKRYTLPFLILAIVGISIVGCKPLSPLFDQVAYKNAIDLKVESVFLMREATDSFPKYEDDVKELKMKLEKAYEYEKGRGIDINSETLSMWDTLRSENAGLLGEFLKKWEKDTVRTEYFINQKIPQVQDAFDKIIRVENKRRRESVELTKSEK